MRPLSIKSSIWKYGICSENNKLAVCLLRNNKISCGEESKQVKSNHVLSKTIFFINYLTSAYNFLFLAFLRSTLFHM